MHTFRVGSVPIPGSITSGMYYQCLTNQIQWAAPETVLSGYEQVTNSTLAWQKAAGQEGRFALLWEQSKVDEFVIGVWDGCTQIKQKSVPDINPAHYDVHSLAVSPQQACFTARKSYTQDYYYYTLCAEMMP